VANPCTCKFHCCYLYCQIPLLTNSTPVTRTSKFRYLQFQPLLPLLLTSITCKFNPLDCQDPLLANSAPPTATLSTRTHLAPKPAQNTLNHLHTHLYIKVTHLRSLIILITLFIKNYWKKRSRQWNFMYAKHDKIRQHQCRLTALFQEPPRISAYTIYFSKL